jgi:hypothetical protein
MSAPTWIKEVLLPGFVGSFSGFLGSVITSRATVRGYERERRDKRLPAVRAYALVNRNRAEAIYDPRRSGPTDEEWEDATAAFDSYRHDLPPRIRRLLNRVDDINDLQLYADHCFSVSRTLFNYLEWQSLSGLRRVLKRSQVGLSDNGSSLKRKWKRGRRRLKNWRAKARERKA